MLKVIITGNPRSGTSFTCDLICRMGLHPGSPQNIKPPDVHNKYGYWEHIPLLTYSNAILKKLGIDYFRGVKAPPIDWSKSLTSEQELIQKMVHDDKIEVYKDNTLIILSDIYIKLFPEAKWIYVTRNFKECYKSRWGEPISEEDYLTICQKRASIWHSTDISKRCLYIDYSDYDRHLEMTLFRIADFVGIDIRNKLKELKTLHRPNRK